MYVNLTLEEVLLEDYNVIDSGIIAEDKINIDMDLVVENSSAKYLQLFASFLNGMLEEGYYIAEPILNKLMGIIDYEGYEHQIMEQYANIIINTVLSRKFKTEPILSPEESKEFIIKYIETVKSKGEVPFPLDNDNDRPIQLIARRELKEVEYPIDFLYKQIKSGAVDKRSKKYIRTMYIIYNNNLLAYKDLLKSDISLNGLVFLLEEDTTQARDILKEYITTVDSLFRVVDKLTSVNDIAKKNIEIVLENLFESLDKETILDQIMNIF